MMTILRFCRSAAIMFAKREVVISMNCGKFRCCEAVWRCWSCDLDSERNVIYLRRHTVPRTHLPSARQARNNIHFTQHRTMIGNGTSFAHRIWI